MEPNTPPPQTPAALGNLIVASLPGMAAGYAGRHYFGGFGGALLGYALYTCFVKPVFKSHAILPS